jgi:hypothetical protein
VSGLRVDVLPGNPPGWQEATITIPGLGVIECARLADGSFLDTPYFRWDDKACETVAAALDQDPS